MLSPAFVARFLALAEPLEGRKSWLYLDVKRLPTTGLGCLVPRLSVMLSLPWQRSDGSPATEAEKRTEWARVGMMAGGLVATRYWTPEALTLSEEAIDALASQRLEADAAILAAHWPEWPWMAVTPRPSERRRWRSPRSMLSARRPYYPMRR